MGRPRKPTAVLELGGSFEKNPQRRREREDEPIPSGGIGPPPELGPFSFAEAWDYIVANTPPGVLTNRDRVYLEIAASLLAHVRTAGIENINASKLGRLEVMLGKLGLNPSDASRVRQSPLARARQEEQRQPQGVPNPFARIDRIGKARE